MKNYYYFISSLKDISTDTEPAPYEVSELIGDAQGEVRVEEYAVIKSYLYRYDNRNLMLLLNNDEESDFSDLGTFTKEELEEEIKAPFKVPRYMADFLDANKKGIRIYPELSLENELNTLYYLEMQQSENAFVSQFFRFDGFLKNLTTALNCRKSGLETEGQLLPIDSSYQALSKSTANDFGMSGMFPWINRIVEPFNNEEMLNFEIKVEQVRFEAAEQLVGNDFFSVNSILSYLIRLDIVQRLNVFRKDSGESKLKSIIDEMLNKYNLVESLEAGVF